MQTISGEHARYPRITKDAVMPKDWVIPPPAAQRDDLARTLRISPIVAQALCNRGVTDAAVARQFMKPQLTDMLPPEAFPATIRAAERICDAVSAGKKIVIFGDYDVDGVTAVSIIWHCLTIAGASPGFYIPHRLEEGYGISADAIGSLADDGAQLIISVDCGITAIEPAKLARQRGVDLIITDHHQPHRDAEGNPLLPDAMIVHPGVTLPGDPEYPNPHLAGAGVALKLAWAIAQRVSGTAKVRPDLRDFLVDAIGLAAMGTVADVVPLISENRIIAHHGLLGLPQSKLAGIQALLQMSGVTGRKLEGYDIGFKLGPRLNAIGRMGHARLAVEMLTRATPDEAMKIAQHLDQLNKDRQSLERRISNEAHQMVADTGQDSDAVRAIVLASPGWHAGVIGIVAGRIAESFGKPTVMIAIENGTGQGSARSIKNFPLDRAFADCAEHLIQYGGHAMAAGLKIEAAKVDAFRDAFAARAAQLLTSRDMQSKLTIDDQVSLGQLDEPLVHDLSRLEPFGAGNPAPLLATSELEIVGEPRTVGGKGTHLQVTLAEGRRQFKAIAFGQAALKPALLDHRRCRVAFRPIINEWNGRRTVEMQVVDFQFAQA